ncbi:MAG TPA: LptA/OstA family protein [Vicinamibacterales bacterium]|nr:LptA/OstA family protein [Vicinamibacterales bacterium]
MRWQRAAQAAIAVFVIGFIAMLATSLRRQQAVPPQQAPPQREQPTAAVETPGGIDTKYSDASGRVLFGVKATKHFAYPDGRNVLAGEIEITTTRKGKPMVVKADNGEFMPKDSDIEWATFRGNVRLTTEGGAELRADEAKYTKADGIVTIPGRVEFAKGRMKGSGVGATYDQNREVLWIKDQARVDVAPASGGDGGLEATARAIGLARAEHYIRLEGDARITGEGRVAEANDITVRLTDDDERVRLLELRGNSRITGGSGGPQAMSARDIDMAYAGDGRTLQHAGLVENAVVQLAGSGTGAGNRITGSAIDIGLGPDGSTITSLAAANPVQVDLPAEGDAPAKTIRSAALTAAGAPGTGLQNATFSGGVEYRETRAARPKLAAIDRTARSETLIVETKPGLGAIQKADFRGNVKFTDPPDFVGEAQQGIYHLAQDRLELMSAAGQPGPASPTVTDGKVSVAARTIQFSLSTREMSAETNVRSTMRSGDRATGRSGGRGKLPSMLAQDEPVNVTANRLVYKGAGSAAEYSGNVVLWQGKDTTIKAAAMSIDDKTGNLTATGNAVTTFAFEETDSKTATRKRELTTGSAEQFTYVDARRLATYTGKAHIQGAQGDVTGEKIELFMKAGVNELERAEAYGANGSVQVREGNRIAKGSHLTYTAADDLYLMIGTPVEVIEEKNRTCTLTVGNTVTFNRATERARVDGSASGNIQMSAKTLKACPPGLIR